METPPPVELQVVSESVSKVMCKCVSFVVEWQDIEPPSRMAIGSKDLRELTHAIRKQPANFMIIIWSSLRAAQDGQSLCKRGSKVTKVLLGEEMHPKEDTVEFLKKSSEEIQEYATKLKGYASGIHNNFRLLKMAVMYIHTKLDIVIKNREKPDFLVRLSRGLSKDVKTCEATLQEIRNEIENIEEVLQNTIRWWQGVRSQANHLVMNSHSELVAAKNTILLGEIRGGFDKLERYFADYLEKMQVLYDENVLQLNDVEKAHVEKTQDCAKLVFAVKSGRVIEGK